MCSVCQCGWYLQLFIRGTVQDGDDIKRQRMKVCEINPEFIQCLLFLLKLSKESLRCSDLDIHRPTLVSVAILWKVGAYQHGVVSLCVHGLTNQRLHYIITTSSCVYFKVPGVLNPLLNYFLLCGNIKDLWAQTFHISALGGCQNWTLKPQVYTNSFEILFCCCIEDETEITFLHIHGGVVVAEHRYTSDV